MKHIIIQESQLDRLILTEKLNNMDAPLYHFTSIEKLGGIIKSNMLGNYKSLPKKMRCKYDINMDNRDELEDYRVFDNGFEDEPAVTCFTRDRNSDNGYPSSFDGDLNVRIKLNPQELLKDRNMSINPFNFNFILRKNGTISYPKEYSRIGKGGRMDVESEERLVGGVMNLDQKVMSIDIYYDDELLSTAIYKLRFLPNYEKYKNKIRVYTEKNDFNFERYSYSIDEFFHFLKVSNEENTYK